MRLPNYYIQMKARKFITDYANVSGTAISIYPHCSFFRDQILINSGEYRIEFEYGCNFFLHFILHKINNQGFILKSFELCNTLAVGGSMHR